MRTQRPTKGRLCPFPHAKAAPRQEQNLTGQAFYALDRQGRIQRWSAEAQALFGYSAQEVLGWHHHRLYEPSSVHPLPEHYRLFSSIAPDSLCYEGWFRGKDERLFWAKVTMIARLRASAALRAEVISCAVECASITDHHQDRLAFQAALLNRVRSAILATDTQGRLIYMNAYAEHLFALPWAQANGRYLKELALWPDDLALPVPPRRPGKDRLEREITATKTDGTSFPALRVTSISPAPDGHGYSETHIVHDLSDLRAMQAALQHGANLAFLGRMSASLVHEISQPMNVIRLTAEGSVLKMARACVEQAEISLAFQTIADQAARLFETIEFMQTFSRQGSTATPSLESDTSEGRSFDLAHSLREVMSVLGLGRHQTPIAITSEIPLSPAPAYGQARQIEQVLINLFNNASYAVSHPPVEQPKIHVTLTQHDDAQWRLTIEDNGPGVAPDALSQIFEPFFTTKPQGQGTGLGLAISLEIARIAGGNVSYCSSSLGGACFCLTLPCAHLLAPSGIPSAPPQDGLPAGEEKGHLLIVEDEADSRQSLSQALGLLGYRVSSASGAWEALRLLGSEGCLPVDVVITDLRMPDGNGFELLSALAQEYPQLFTIVITGQARQEREDLSELMENCDAVFAKPVSLKALADTLASFYRATTTAFDAQ